MPSEAVADGVDNWTDDICCLFFGVVFLFDNAFEEFTAFHLFKRQIYVVGLIKDLVELNHVWVVELRENIDFLLEGKFIVFLQVSPRRLEQILTFQRPSRQLFGRYFC